MQNSNIYVSLPYNQKYECIFLLEDSYDLYPFWYHKLKDSYKKVKCWCMEYSNSCYLCWKWEKPLFLSIMPIYIRNIQENSNIFLNSKKDYDNLMKLFQTLVISKELTPNLNNLKDCIFEVVKTNQGIEFKFLRKHSYKKMNLEKSINIKEYIKKNYPPLDSFVYTESDFILKKLKHLQQFNEEESI